MSEQVKQYWSEDHYKIYNEIEELRKKKEALASETKEIDYLGGRKVAVRRYNEFELPKLYEPIDAQIQELQAKFLSILFQYKTLTMNRDPIIYMTEHEEFKIILRGSKWVAYSTLVGVPYESIKVITDEQNMPIKIQFLMCSSETYGKVYTMVTNLKEYIAVQSPRILPPIYKKIEPLPTWHCKKCTVENYIEVLNCRGCNEPKPIDKEPELEKKENSADKIKGLFKDKDEQ